MAATAVVGLVPSAAHAALVPVLDTVTLVGLDYEFSYSATLAGDTGLVEGDRLVIFDFRGYVEGSISSGIYAADVDAYTEFTSQLAPPPGYPDNPNVVNLVFEWTGFPFNASSGPFADVSFAGFTARSNRSAVGIDGYAAVTAINNGAATGLAAFDSGPVAVPMPEPSTEAPAILGLAGAMWRKRRAGLASRPAPRGR
jgi:hypothetical protein